MEIRNLVLRLFVIAMITGCSKTEFIETLVQNKNIYVTKPAGKMEQVTYLGKDSLPVISPDKKIVYFVRQTGNMGEYEYEGVEQLAIMQVDLNSLQEEKLTDTIHYQDWGTTSGIYQVTGFTLSQDGRYIFFIAQKWSTSGVLVKLDTQTKKMTELSHGDNFEVLKDGQFKGHIIVTRSSIKTNAGRQWSNWLMSIDGKPIKEIGDDDAVANFKLKQSEKK